MTTAKKNDPAAGGLPTLSDSERKEAAKDAAMELAKDGAKAQDGFLPGDSPPKNQFLGSDEVMQYAHLLDLSPDELKRVIAEDTGYGIPEEKVAGLLKLERNGKNRTDYVKVLLDRLPVDSPLDVPGAGGPGYTNDTTPITEL
jgi:hypothetical protein